jgi:hypothetical protein
MLINVPIQPLLRDGDSHGNARGVSAAADRAGQGYYQTATICHTNCTTGSLLPRNAMQMIYTGNTFTEWLVRSRRNTDPGRESRCSPQSVGPPILTMPRSKHMDEEAWRWDR